MRKQIHPHSHDATILHTNGATTWSFCFASPSVRQGSSLYEISNLDVFLVRKGRVSRASENALSRFKKR